MTAVAAVSLDAAFARVLRRCWHPVCTLTELDAAGAPASRPHERRVLAVTLLGEDLAVARLADGSVMAVPDRCPHRSARLSVGFTDGCALRCAYHGWRFERDGTCTDVPALPRGPIPPKASLRAPAARIAYGLVWVRFEHDVATEVPPCSAWLDAAEPDPLLRVLHGEPYTWPVGAPRRVENFVDLSHFAWVHAGSLGRRDQPEPPLPEIAREGGRLGFRFESPDMDADARALFGIHRYRMPMPLTVEINFEQRSGARRVLWMTASPITMERTRTFWFVARSDALDEDDAEHLAFQQRILDEDEPVVCNQVPAALPLDPAAEVSVRTDRVSIEYRRFLRDLALAVDDRARLAELLGVHSPAHDTALEVTAAP